MVWGHFTATGRGFARSLLRFATSSRRRGLRERVRFDSSLCVVYAGIAARCPRRARALVMEVSRSFPWNFAYRGAVILLASARDTV
jgi:hypothetical protein